MSDSYESSSQVDEGKEELEAQQKEMQTKKLMTIVKSKFFMLKANFPKQALLIDEEPLIDSHERPNYDFT